MERLQRFALWVLQPKVGLPLALMLCLIASPFVYRATRLTGLPDCGHPFDVEAFGTQEVPDEENAFVEYRKAEKLFKKLPFNNDDYVSLDKALEEGWSEATANVRQWVTDNRACLEVWRRGTEKPDALYLQPKDVKFDTEFPLFDVARDNARLACLEGSRLEEAGDLDAAWGWYRATLRSSRHFGKRGGMMERMIGMANHATASKAIATWASHDDLMPQQLRQAIDNLKNAYAMTAPASVACKCEYLYSENMLKPSSLIKVISIESGLGGDLGRAAGTVLFFQNEPEMGRRVMRQAYANWLTQIDKPRHQRRP